MKQPMDRAALKQPMDHPWSSAGVETTARSSWSWRACAIAALWCGLYVVVLLPALVVYTVVCTFLDAVAAVVSRTPAPAPLRRDARPELVFPGTCTWVFWQLGMVQYLVERYDLRDVRVVGTSSGAVAAAAILTLKVQRNRTINAKTNEYTTVNEAADLSSSTVSARTHVSLD